MEGINNKSICHQGDDGDEDVNLGNNQLTILSRDNTQYVGCARRCLHEETGRGERRLQGREKTQQIFPLRAQGSLRAISRGISQSMMRLQESDAANRT